MKKSTKQIESNFSKIVEFFYFLLVFFNTCWCFKWLFRRFSLPHLKQKVNRSFFVEHEFPNGLFKMANVHFPFFPVLDFFPLQGDFTQQFCKKLLFFRSIKLKWKLWSSVDHDLTVVDSNPATLLRTLQWFEINTCLITLSSQVLLGYF